MTDHLTDIELRGFASGGLMADDLLRADDHLCVCDRCRARALALNDAGSRVDDLRGQVTTPPGHLTDEEIQLVAERRSSAGASDAMRRHMKDCFTCAGHVEDLRSWAEAGQPARARRAPRFLTVRLGSLALAATILVAIVIPAAIRYARSHGPTASSASNVGPT